MPDRHVQCSACDVLRPEGETHNIPTLDRATNSYIDGYYCDAHASAALATVRAHIAGLDLEDDERDDMTPLVMLHALVRSRGLMSEFLPAGTVAGEGMEHVRNEALALLDLLPHTRLPIGGPSALCSGCYRTVLAAQVRVIPWFNDSVAEFVTTFRCGDCVGASLADTRARLAAGGAREISQLAEFFQRHAITILEHRRGDPPETVRPLVERVLDMIERREHLLKIGETVPLQEALAARAPASPPPAAAPPSPPPSAPPPSAQPAAEAGSPSLWQRLRRVFGRG
ncbi:hypothetical protein [Nannocystis radixulma]|uniref:Uncharacterized protein n=1 Tax=Nannocystis radixulma TaxID=2995305 RepID=A0ABT5B315_9BACT|nr:hypothetical protein [Nannocystis radixulma]MDC0668494.1 hypothetical protein [Nannocystis radixulma]